MSSILSGRRILLTRPGGQAESLARRLRAHGTQVQHFPAIRITLTPPDETGLASLEQTDVIIFASVNAVRGLVAISAWNTALVRRAQIFAIGPATDQALRRVGLKPTAAAPPPHNSEALLSIPELKMLDRQCVAIVRGQGGREVLAEGLRHRGADVRHLEVYRRDPPAATLSLKKMPGGAPEAICITSTEIAKNLLSCIKPEERPALLRHALVVGNLRIADACRELGYTAPVGTADNPGDDAMINALIHYFTALPSGK